MRLAELLGTLSLAAEAGTGIPRAAIIATRLAQLSGAGARDTTVPV
jgi:hypothetical protein